MFLFERSDVKKIRNCSVLLNHTHQCKFTTSHISSYRTYSGESTSDIIMEMLVMCYACRTSSARKIIGIVTVHVPVLLY